VANGPDGAEAFRLDRTRFQDRKAGAGEFADRYALLTDPYWSIPGLLRPYSGEKSLIQERPVKLGKPPLSRFLR